MYVYVYVYPRSNDTLYPKIMSCHDDPKKSLPRYPLVICFSYITYLSLVRPSLRVGFSPFVLLGLLVFSLYIFSVAYSILANYLGSQSGRDLNQVPHFILLSVWVNDEQDEI